MRRFIIQKRANSQDFIDKNEVEKFLVEARRCLRPQSSFKDMDSIESPYLNTENSNASFYAPPAVKPTQQTNKRPLPSTLRGAKRIKELLSSSLDEKSTQKNVPTEFCIKGRPLTANSVYITRQKAAVKGFVKKRSSIGSCGEQDLSDPKSFDEEYTNIEEYAKGLLCQSERKGNKAVIVEKSCEESEDRSVVVPVKVPVVVRSGSPQRRIGLVVATKLGFRTHTKTVYSNKGKILKGLCSRPSVPRNNKLFHNILIS